MKKHLLVGAAGLLLAATVAPASALVDFDASTGTGFVGKGDVQLAFDWNNKALQANAAGVSFSYQASSTTTTTWTCDRDGGDQTQERTNVTTTTTQGVVSSVARERNQVTGFLLEGWSGGAVSEEVSHDGPRIGSCPTFWTAIDLVEGEPDVIGGGLVVTYGGVSHPLG